MRVLIGGERFGLIRDQFLKRGHDAWSCDLAPAEGQHLQCNWREIWGDGWDIGIFHPTCTYMANCSAKHLYKGMQKAGGLNEERWLNMGRAAWEFWDLLETCPIPRFAVENPVMLGYAQTMIKHKPTQKFQPWEFGDDPKGPDNESKETWLWLKGLPKLRPLGVLDGSTARQSTFRAAPTKDPEERRMKRSKTFPGVARAMAEQWGALAEEVAA